MTADRDPYATLGLPRTASLDEVKRAYRRLAKANHPDAAGEAALPRFLAIQAAYDRIVGPANGTNRATGGSNGGPGGTEASRPYSADPSRARATHRAYGGRSRRTRASGGPSGTASGATGTAPGSTGTNGTAGGGGTGPAGASRADASASAGPAPGAQPGSDGAAGTDGTGTAGDGGSRSSRPPRSGRAASKATLGSTSYDGAEKEPFEPDWGGASWYGTTSGTYWTLNPKEYADPRKHGPEYQARARRGRRSDPAAPPPPLETVTDAGPVAPAREPSVEPEGGSTGPTVPPTHTATSWWQSTPTDADGPAIPGQGRPATERPAATGAGSAGGAAAGAAAWTATTGTAAAGPGASAASSSGASGPPPDLAATTASIRDWFEGGDAGIVGRVGRAVIGWAPIALGIGWFAGEVTGCARFAATCDTSVAPVAWILQLLALLLLVVATRLATIATIATTVTLAAAVPGALILSATGGATDVASGRAALGGLLVIAWVAGIGVGVWREWRRRGPAAGPSPPTNASGGPGPVS